MAQKETIVREVSRVFFEKDGFTIASTTEGHSVLGDVVGQPLIVGCEYEFTGSWVDNPKFGKQLKFTSHCMRKSASRLGLVNLLDKTCKGIGPQLAHRIFDEFGSNGITLLRDDPDQVAEKVDRLRPYVAITASKELKDMGEFLELEAKLAELFGGRGFPKDTYKEVVEEWATEAPDIITKNPYALLQHKITGCGFARVDNLYLELGHKENALRRQFFCMEHIIRSMCRGSTWMKRVDVKRMLGEMVSKARPEVAERGALKLHLLHIHDDLITLRSRAMKELAMADIVKGMLESDETQWPKSIEGISNHQQEQLAIATSKRIGIFEGKGGTGKTYSLASLVKSINDKSLVLCVAPTGKAAVRMTENLRQQGVEGIEAMTIHRALGFQGHKGHDQKFMYHAGNRLPYKFILADEQSMLSTELAYALFSALGRDAHVLLTGDDGQLPPIDHGAVFRDLKEVIPVGTLTEVHRYTGNVAEEASNVRDGKAVQARESLAIDDGLNITFKTCKSSVDFKRHIMKLVRKFPGDPIWDLQFICPVKKGDIGTEAINKMIQAVVNKSEKIKGVAFRVGDKVLNTKNQGYPKALPDWKEIQEGNEMMIQKDRYPIFEHDEEGSPIPGEFVANGEQGLVLHVDIDLAVIQFDMPSRIVVLKRSEFIYLDLAYAITCHKSQGSQWPVVVPIVDPSRRARMIGSRQLWYTAITRMEKACILLGCRSSMASDARNDEISKRITRLKENIACTSQKI